MTEILNKQVSTKTATIVFGVLIIACLFAFYVGAQWQEPSEPPPQANVPPPINTGPENQKKQGSLEILDGALIAPEFRDTDTNYFMNLSAMSKLGGPISIAPTNPIGPGVFVLEVKEDMNVTSGVYYHNGNAGTTTSPPCAPGEVLKGVNVQGGIVTTGTCATDETGAGGGITCLDCDSRFVNVTGDTMTGILNTAGGLIIETRTSDPSSPATGRIWLRTDI